MRRVVKGWVQWPALGLESLLESEATGDSPLGTSYGAGIGTFSMMGTMVLAIWLLRSSFWLSGGFQWLRWWKILMQCGGQELIPAEKISWGGMDIPVFLPGKSWTRGAWSLQSRSTKDGRNWWLTISTFTFLQHWFQRPTPLPPEPAPVHQDP